VFTKLVIKRRSINAVSNDCLASTSRQSVKLLVILSTAYLFFLAEVLSVPLSPEYSDRYYVNVHCSHRLAWKRRKVVQYHSHSRCDEWSFVKLPDTKVGTLLSSLLAPLRRLFRILTVPLRVRAFCCVTRLVLVAAPWLLCEVTVITRITGS
jgi:hypothetical protein